MVRPATQPVILGNGPTPVKKKRRRSASSASSLHRRFIAASSLAPARPHSPRCPPGAGRCRRHRACPPADARGRRRSVALRPPRPWRRGGFASALFPPAALLFFLRPEERGLNLPPRPGPPGKP